VILSSSINRNAACIRPRGSPPRFLTCLTQATIGEEQGLFLAESWRLHPNVCAFTSELFYDNRLVSRPENATQCLNAQGSLDGTGLRFVPIDHSGNQSESPEEAERISEIVEQLLREGTTWTNKKGEVAPLLLKDILIVAPYNAQVSALAQSLPAGARVGTVDKFQGQEAPVVIYSMTTSTPADAPRGMEFLYSSNRLNVATSRAHALQCWSLVLPCSKCNARRPGRSSWRTLFAGIWKWQDEQQRTGDAVAMLLRFLVRYFSSVLSVIP